MERAKRLYAGGDVEIARLEGIESLRARLGQVLRRPPQVLVVIDIGDDTVVAAVVARLRGVPTIVDTGDVVFELERSRGARSSLGLALVWAGERGAIRAASHVVVRGREHLRLIGSKATFAPDVAPAYARPIDGKRVREQCGLDGFVVGLVGSMNRAPRLGLVYGWDVIAALLLVDPSVQALLVGDGPGRGDLEDRARDLGVLGRCWFTGAIDPNDTPEWIGAMDVAVSTQTNDLVGAVRTTGKLPLYLACGCPVLASDVGEARRVLGPLGWTIPYSGVVDLHYPQRLAGAIEELRADPDEAARRRTAALEVHQREYDAAKIRRRIRGLIDDLLSRNS
jgi:glycosyltransferase involved in cell wall biosynthesis